MRTASTSDCASSRDRRRPSSVMVLVLAVAIGGVQRLSAQEQADGNLPVTIQIHDYARVPSQALSRASAIVTAVYAKIGVRTEWTGVFQREVRRGGSSASRELSNAPIAQLTILILTPKMAARGRFADGVLGLAAVADEGMGRIAYAIYDRVRSTAAQAGMDEGDLLGFVIAHEIGHLLLPR